MVKKSLFAGTKIVLIVAATASFAAAQQTNPGQTAFDQPRNNGAPVRNGVPAMRHDVGHYMLDCLIGGNQAEIALARIAEQRASDPEVKKFAQRMIKDHSMFIEKLQSTWPVDKGQEAGAPPAVRRRGVDVNVPGARIRVQSGQAANPNTTNDPADRVHPQMPGGARQFVQVMKEVEAQCLQSATRELSQKEGVQFDRCYMTSQVMAHMKMADELTVFSRHAASDVQPVLQAGLQTTRQHLALAKQIAERLEGTHRTTARDRNTIGQ